MSRGCTRLASSMFTMVSPRFFSTAATRAVLSNEMVKAPAVGLGVRCRSSMAAIGGGDKEQEKKQAVGGGGSAKKDKGTVSYWGLDPTKVSKEDASPWKWTCFRVL